MRFGPATVESHGFASEDASTFLHEERLDAVERLLRDSGARTVLDLGCGSGALLRRLLEGGQFTRIVGLDTSLESLALAERLRNAGAERLALRHGSFTSADAGLTGFDAAAMVETIEHVEPAHLSRVEQAVFGRMRPGLVVMTTPNREYNELYGMADGELRHADHRFEWDRSRFETWAAGVGKRNGYRVEFEAVGRANAWVGGPTQMAIFRLDEDRGPAEALNPTAERRTYEE
jgi:3' terminal RNA ribose 2'-O-methyltransferase Hen1